MAWVRIDDHFNEHPKIAQLGPLAIAMHVVGLVYCNRNLTDGFVPIRVTPRLIDLDGLCDNNGDQIRCTEIVDELVDVGVWDPVTGGYQIHDYLDYQKSKEEITADREAARVRQEKRRNRVTGKFEGVTQMSQRDMPVSHGDVTAMSQPPQPQPQVIDTPTEYLARGEIIPLRVNDSREAAKARHPASQGRQRPVDEIWEALIYVGRIDSTKITKTQRGALNKAVSELRSVGATADEIQRKAVAYRLAYPNVSLTPSALVKHWGSIEGIATQPEISKDEIAIRKWVAADE